MSVNKIDGEDVFNDLFEDLADRQTLYNVWGNLNTTKKWEIKKEWIRLFDNALSRARFEQQQLDEARSKEAKRHEAFVDGLNI